MNDRSPGSLDESTAAVVRGTLALAACTLLWSTGGLLIKLVSWNPVAIAGARSLVSSIVLIIYLRKPRITWSLPQIGAGLAYSVTMILFVMANKMTASANAILLQYTSPIFVAPLGIFLLREKPTRSDLISMVLIVIGTGIFFFDRLSPEGFAGNLLAIASGFTMALFVVLMRMQKEGSSLESILIGHLITTVLAIPFYRAPWPDAGGIVGLLLLGTFQVGMASIFFSYGIKRLPALRANLIMFLEPIFNPVWVFLAIREIPGTGAVAGGLVILATILGRTLTATRPRLRRRAAP